jgi:hypothetical protein
MGVVLVSGRFLQGPSGPIHDHLHEIVEGNNFEKNKNGRRIFLLPVPVLRSVQNPAM